MARQQDRDERLAAALRDNLRKRKARERGIASGTPDQDRSDETPKLSGPSSGA